MRSRRRAVRPVASSSFNFLADIADACAICGIRAPILKRLLQVYILVYGATCIIGRRIGGSFARDRCGLANCCEVIPAECLPA